MKKVTLKDSKGNEINDIMKDVLTFDCETTGLPPKGAKWGVDFAEFPNIVQLAWTVNEKGTFIYHKAGGMGNTGSVNRSSRNYSRESKRRGRPIC